MKFHHDSATLSFQEGKLILLLTLYMDGAPSVPWKPNELVAGRAGPSGGSVKQLHRHGPGRVCISEVWLGASWSQAVEGLISFTAARGLLQIRNQQSQLQ